MIRRALSWGLFLFVLVLFAPLYPQGIAGGIVAGLVVLLFMPRSE